MFSRYFLPLFFLVVLLTVLSARAEEDVEERGLFSNKLMKQALKFLGKEFAGAAAGCLEEAAEKCKSDLKHLKNLAKCAGNFLKENKGRCLLD